ncbi:MAG: zinc ribbon domain-containing protein [Acidobacteria bacterium]|nr:zinc ribbon domain-containing protein [Acidobacteriota bacterium]
MAEVAALQKHACPACGAQAEWNASKQLLVCPFCGTEAPYEIDKDTGKIQELDLIKALRELPEEQRGWQTERRSVQCQSCKAVMVYDPARMGQNCEFCGSPALVDYQEVKSPIRPQSLLPFKATQTQVRDNIKRWYGSKWFAPNALKSKALVDQIKGLYIPYWTFDAQVHCRWEAEAGYHYYVTEEYRDNQGHTQTRQVQRTRWEHASGEIDHFFDDEPIAGTKGVDLSLLQQVEPFPTAEVVPYDTAYLSGFVVEHYQVVLVDAAKQSRDAMHGKLMELCGQQVPGDTFRNLQIEPQYSGETFKHVLVPIWLLTYTFGKKTFQVVANGYTGVIAGRYPKSAWKIFFVVMAVLLVILLFALANQ